MENELTTTTPVIITESCFINTTVVIYTELCSAGNQNWKLSLSKHEIHPDYPLCANWVGLSQIIINLDFYLENSKNGTSLIEIHFVIDPQIYTDWGYEIIVKLAKEKINNSFDKHLRYWNRNSN